ncbi:MAG: hypothetical protein ABI995_09385 [Acidobacteriota bacterium]
MTSFLTHRNKLAALGVAAISLAVLASAGKAFLNHEVGTLSMLIAVQTAVFGLALVPAVLTEMADRQTLSVYRAMYIGR